jgi:hypothetical protein
LVVKKILYGAECYTEAVKQAKAETGLPLETFPVQCPYELPEVIDDEFLPEQNTDEETKISLQ